ncbi:DNA-binding response regulator [Streptococcus sp. HMSC034E03]|uniref:response regulator transcription factor n=1 Tax=Streptococcus sp. HMSC034E03 TaxID=1739309 RepID=UPI0008B184A8|nr:response regulator transcription factor [Streptococcus sp. HMSC034E03]OFK70473.1 DNA-binding response regulator [Streptococcus sp. HMSC034E03]
MKILIVEDEDMIREGISDYLTDCGYETIQAGDGEEALKQFFNHQVDLVLLDIQMPKRNGLEVLSEIRKRSQVPVLMLTAFQDEEYKMSAFAALADGYLEKPFSLSLLKVRVDAIFKRYYDTGCIFTYRDTEVDFDSYSAKVAGQEVAVNAKELEILDYLVKNEGRALTRSQIIDAVWKMTDEVPFDRVIDVYIKELRKKLDLDCILTVRNVGYKLERK